MRSIKCTDDLIMDPAALAGRRYEIIDEDDNTLVIRNEQGEPHHFDKDPVSESYFGRWFSHDQTD